MSHVDRPVRWQEAAAGSVATVVLRSSTEQLLDDLERAVNDGVNTYKARPTAPASSDCRVQQGQTVLAWCPAARGADCMGIGADYSSS